MAVEVGQPAPDFTLYDADRQQRSLAEFRGKSVVLAFYPGAFTGVCTTEMCTFRDRMERFNSMNSQVLGISVDGAFAQKVFSDQNNLNFPRVYHVVYDFGGCTGDVTQSCAHKVAETL